MICVYIVPTRLIRKGAVPYGSGRCCECVIQSITVHPVRELTFTHMFTVQCSCTEPSAVLKLTPTDMQVRASPIQLKTGYGIAPRTFEYITHVTFP